MIEIILAIFGVIGIWGCYGIFVFILFAIFMIYIGRKHGTLRGSIKRETPLPLGIQKDESEVIDFGSPGWFHKHQWESITPEKDPEYKTELVGDGWHAIYRDLWRCKTCGRTEKSEKIAFL